MAINIDRNNPDQFYRYKMPRLQAKVEGSGNGIKTVVANITDIAKSLDRPPSYPLKYFGYELGAQTMIDSKNDRYIVNGAHDAPRLQEMLDGFIKKFVLCAGCNNPETVLQVYPKKNVIKQQCAACGYSGMVDMKHKLTSYILKNPPAEAGEYGKSAKPTKAEKKTGKKNGKDDDAKKNGTNGHGNGAGDKAPISPGAEGPELDIPPPVEGDDEDDFDDDWGEDDPEEAKKRREEILSGGIANLTMTDDLEKTEAERLDMFYEFVKKRKDAKGTIDDKAVLAEAERLEVREKAPLILARVLLDENMQKQIGQYRKVFLRFTVNNPRAQKWLLGGFEYIVGQAFASALLSKAAIMLKELYDQDILDEAVVLEWYEKPSKKYVAKNVSEEIRKKVFPLIKWLREAESESSEEDGSDEIGVEEPKGKNVAKNGKGKAGDAKIVNNNHTAKTNGKAPGSGSATPPTEEEGDDVDIDAI